MGADVVTIDFNADSSWDELMEIVQLANLYIYEDHPIDIQFYRGAELDKVEMCIRDRSRRTSSCAATSSPRCARP